MYGLIYFCLSPTALLELCLISTNVFESCVGIVSGGVGNVLLDNYAQPVSPHMPCVLHYPDYNLDLVTYSPHAKITLKNVVYRRNSCLVSYLAVPMLLLTPRPKDCPCIQQAPSALVTHHPINTDEAHQLMVHACWLPGQSLRRRVESKIGTAR